MTLAIIAEIKVRKHPNADRVQLGDVLGYQVVVGMGVKDGDTGIFFREGLQLSEDFVKEKKLGREDGGYFEANRRVRCQKFRGEKSEGFWIPHPGVVGTRLDSLDGKIICTKYVTPETFVRRGQKRKGSRKGTLMFKPHFETDQWPMNSNRFSYEHAIVTLKMHGTSQRTGYVKDGGVWRYLTGSRNVVLEGPRKTWWQRLCGWFGRTTEDRDWYGEPFRLGAAQAFIGQLRKGETVYYEIVGYAGEKPIMSAVTATGDIAKQYGKNIIYHYGQDVGTFGVYVYRICMCNEDGDSVEYSWEDVKLRCRELNVRHVPELGSGADQYIGLGQRWA